MFRNVYRNFCNSLLKTMSTKVLRVFNITNTSSSEAYILIYSTQELIDVVLLVYIYILSYNIAFIYLTCFCVCILDLDYLVININKY